jgi:hypothetical protein
MQQVHERAYDFSRFTQSGHRWLFKRFSEINAGPIEVQAQRWSGRFDISAVHSAQGTNCPF